jgi:putative DNA primase/helicase
MATGLVIPLYNALTGGLQTVQTIGPDGAKLYYTGLSTKLACCAPQGEFSLPNKKNKRDNIYVCEGWATGCAIEAAINRFNVICAMSAGNLKDVVEAIRKRKPANCIIICADNDTETEAKRGFNPGVREANSVAHSVVNCKVAIPPPGDFLDLFVNSGADAVTAVLEAAAEPKPEEKKKEEAPPPNDGMTAAERAEIARLAKLSKFEYEKERKSAADLLGIRASVLDELIAALRPADEATAGGNVSFEPINPWTEKVQGTALVDATIEAIKKHVILSDEQALAVALWIIHAHALDSAEHSPRLHIASPVKRCGKTRLLTTVATMVPRPLMTENITQAALFRIIEKAQPTVLMDEADLLLKDNDDLKSMLNAGYGRNGTAIRTAGDDHDVKLFNVWAPVVIAGIGWIPDTIEDRSITISLRRRKKDEDITRLRSNRTGHLKQIGRQVARWVDDNKIALGNADPELPEDLGDREHDNWRPLIAVADLISEALGKRARAAALHISRDETKDDEGANVLCLGDVAKIFVDKKADHLSSEEIIRELCRMDERPWSSWRKGNPMTTHSLSRLLKPFGIKPEQIRVGTAAGDKIRGYHAAPVKEAKERYVAHEEEPTEQPL